LVGNSGAKSPQIPAPKSAAIVLFFIISALLAVIVDNHFFHLHLAIILILAFRTVRNLIANFLHVDGLHVVADEVAELLIPAVAAILPPVAHLGVVDAGGVAASPIQLGVAVGANTLIVDRHKRLFSTSLGPQHALIVIGDAI